MYTQLSQNKKQDRQKAILDFSQAAIFLDVSPYNMVNTELRIQETLERVFQNNIITYAQGALSLNKDNNIIQTKDQRTEGKQLFLKICRIQKHFPKHFLPAMCKQDC